MKKYLLVTAYIAALTAIPASAQTSDWGQVQAAGRAYYETWRAGDKEKTAAALKNYESLASVAYAEEKAGKVVPTTYVQTSASGGKKSYDAACVACHGAGVAGAPRFGDKAAWAPRIAQGVSVLEEHALKGFQGKAGMMPPKGGSTLSDAEVKAAVAYMVSSSK